MLSHWLTNDSPHTLWDGTNIVIADGMDGIGWHSVKGRSGVEVHSAAGLLCRTHRRWARDGPCLWFFATAFDWSLVGPFAHLKVQIGASSRTVKGASHSRPFDLGIGICCRCTKKTASLTVLQGFAGLTIALTAHEGMVAAVLTVAILVPSSPIERIANPRDKLGPMLGNVGPARSGGFWSAILGMAGHGWAWQRPPEGPGAAHRGSSRRGINHWPRRGLDRGSSSI